MAGAIAGRRKRPDDSGARVMTGLYLLASVVEKLDAIAGARRTSRSAVIEEILEDGCDRIAGNAAIEKMAPRRP